MQIRSSRVRVTQPILVAFLVFLGSLLGTTFLSHSFTPAYNSRAEDTIYSDFSDNPAISFAITDPSIDTTDPATPSNVVSSIELDVNPNQYATKTVNLSVGTDHERGFTLSFSDEDEDTALYRDGDSSSEYKIPSLSSSVSESTFPANTWGYSFDTDPTLTPIPTLPQGSVLATEALAGDYTYPFTIAVKVDHSLPAGSYSDTVVFTVVGNPAPRVYLQDLTTEQCKNLELEQQYLYYDRRDEKAYTIARLADNNCWMTSNLRLGNEEGGDSITLTSADTNLAPGATFTLPASEGGVWASPSTSQVGAETVHMLSNGSLWLDGSILKDQPTDGIPSTPSKYIGNYYNWYTATAGTGLYDNTTTNTTSDICPKGWRLPSSGDNGEYQTLYAAEGSDYDTFVSNGSWILSGVYSNSGATDHYYGIRGYWWSSTPGPSEAYNAYRLYIEHIDIPSVDPQNNNRKASGLSVRCIYQPTIEGLDSEISFMQDMTDEVCKATHTPLATDNVVPTATLIDLRGKDGSGTVESPVTDKNSSNYQTYIVRKLADGNCWMVQNLNMTLSTSVTLTSDTTDIGYGYSQNSTGTGHNSSNTSTTSGRTSWTPNSTTQTTEGTTWAQDGGNIARSFEPSENIYFPGGKGSGTYDSTATQNYSEYSATGDAYYHIGNYYNWYAATAGTGTATMGTNYREAATDSICPKGWKLPGISGAKSSTTLTATYSLIDNDTTSGDKILVAPLNFVRSGNYNWSYGRVQNRGDHGDWWSTTAYAALYGLHLNISGAQRIVSNYYYAKGDGFSIRCVHRSNDITDLEFLQDISTQLCSATEIGVSTELVDKRDSKNYSIKKLADGKCWMTANLRLGAGAAVTLTPALSDVSSNFSLPVAPTTASSWGTANSATDVNKARLYNTQNDEYGVYYNWFTATAGTGLYANTTTNAPSSLCPKNWKLPTGRTSGEFQSLYVADGSAYSTFVNDGQWILSGYYDYTGYARQQNSNGYWWSRTPYSAAHNAYRLSLSASAVVPQNYDNKAHGFSIRCLAR